MSYAYEGSLNDIRIQGQSTVAGASVTLDYSTLPGGRRQKLTIQNNAATDVQIAWDTLVDDTAGTLTAPTTATLGDLVVKAGTTFSRDMIFSKLFIRAAAVIPINGTAGANLVVIAGRSGVG